MSLSPSLFGPLSIGLPLSALAAELASASIAYPSGESAVSTYFVLGVFGLFILGMASGIAGIIHTKRMRWLPAVGFGFSAIVVILHLAA